MPSPKDIGGITDSTRFQFHGLRYIVTGMASKLPTRLARLTLYSGSNCSLCDVYAPRFICIPLSSYHIIGC
jgi:hypothetical protein